MCSSTETAQKAKLLQKAYAPRALVRQVLDHQCQDLVQNLVLPPIAVMVAAMVKRVYAKAPQSLVLLLPRPVAVLAHIRAQPMTHGAPRIVPIVPVVIRLSVL